MNTIPLSALAPTTRARLEALAVEWLGFDPWGVTALFGSTGTSWWVGEPRVKVLPLDLGAGFDLGVRLVADVEDIPVERFVSYLHGGVWDVPRYGQITDPTERLRAILLDLGRE